MELNLWQVLVLAVVQGITEFLPVSSDGHLVAIMPWLTGRTNSPEDEAVVVVLHMGTLASILLFYRATICELLTKDRRVIGLVIVGTIPAVLIGLPIKFFAEQILVSQLLAGLFLPVTGIIVLYAAHARCSGKEYQALTWPQAFLIGVGQAAAILPGLSRSGSTIAAGVGVGLSRPAAATFSFLLAIPALCGAGVLEVISMLRHGPPATPWTTLAMGVVVSFVVGLAALSWLIRWLERGKLHYFGWYCIILGAALTAWQVYHLR